MAKYGYAVLAVGGLVGTWWFNIQSIRAGDDYLAGWFASPAASSAAIDVIITAIAACVFFVLEGRRLHLRVGWLMVPLTFLVAVAFTFPLYLALREHHLSTQPNRHRTVGSRPTPAEVTW